jgi:hypothetical protein
MGIMVMASIVFVVGVIAVRTLTRPAVFIWTYASGAVRMLVGLCCAVMTSLIMVHDLNTCGRLCPYAFSAGPFVALAALALMLILIDGIQLCGTLFKRRVTGRASPRVRRSLGVSQVCR